MVRTLPLTEREAALRRLESHSLPVVRRMGRNIRAATPPMPTGPVCRAHGLIAETCGRCQMEPQVPTVMLVVLAVVWLVVLPWLSARALDIEAAGHGVHAAQMGER